jgi:hypothetical protein
MNSRTALISGGLVFLLVGALAGYLYGVNSIPARTTTTETTTTTTVTSVSIASSIPDAYGQVASSYANHVLLLESTDTGAVLNGYESNATVEWEGPSGGCDGNFTGTAGITRVMTALLENDSYFLVSNETQTIGSQGNHWVVNSTFGFTGNSTTSSKSASPYSPYVGMFRATIAAQDTYVYSGKTWLITSETWNFLDFETSFLDIEAFAPHC